MLPHAIKEEHMELMVGFKNHPLPPMRALNPPWFDGKTTHITILPAFLQVSRTLKHQRPWALVKTKVIWRICLLLHRFIASNFPYMILSDNA